MRNNKQFSRMKITQAVQAVDRKLSKAERDLRKADPSCASYDSLEREVLSLRQKRSKLIRGLGRS